MPQLSDIKQKIIALYKAALARARLSSWTERAIFFAPLLAALLFAGATVLLDIFVREENPLGWIFSLLGTTGLLLFFFAPITFVSIRLYQRIWPRLRERRFMDALWVGLYLPHAIAVLIIVISQLEGSENIIGLGGAIIVWAMLSLLLSPFTVLLALLGWSYIPKEMHVPEQFLQITSRFNNRGQKLLSAPEPKDDSDPIAT